MSLDGQNNGYSEDHRRYYETTRLINEFGFARKEVLDPLAIYLRDAAHTDLLDIETAKRLAAEVREGERKLQEFASTGRMVGVVDPERMSESDREGFLGWPDDRAEEGQRLSMETSEKRDHLIRANLRLVMYVARRYYRNCGVDLEDRIQDGNLGLIRAVDKYDPTLGAISTYAVYWIRQAIKRAVDNYEGSIIRLPVHVIDEWRGLCKSFREQHGRSPTRQEILDLGFNETKLRGVERSQHVLSLSQNLDRSDEDSHTLGAAVPDQHAEPAWIQIVETSQREADAERIHRVLARLDPRSRRIIKERFGLNPGAERGIEKTQEQVGAGFGVTRARINQLEPPAMKKLAKLVALDIALTGSCHYERYQRPLVDEIRQRAIELSKTMDIVPGFIVRKLLSEDGKTHTWEEIAEYLEMPIEKVRRVGEEAIATIQSFLIGEGKNSDKEDVDNIDAPLAASEFEDDRVVAAAPKREAAKKKPERERLPVEIIMESENGSLDAKKQVKRAVMRLLPFMPPLRYSILTKRWGLNGETVHSFEQIAASLDRKEGVILSNFAVACSDLQKQFESESWWRTLSTSH